MGRAVWSGAISFGLVHVPVKATVATRDHSIRFKQLHEADGEPIRYARMCPEHGEVPYEEVVKGHPVGGGQYVVVTPQELAGLAPEKSAAIEVEAFTNLAAIDPIYFEKAYHLAPDGSGRPYRLLAEAMQHTGKVAIGRFVMRSKEHLVVLRPYQQGLLMELLHFADEVVEPEAFEAKQPTEKERTMATTLVERLSAPFDAEAYEDDFQTRLQAFIEGKAQGRTAQPTVETPTTIDDLETALEASLAKVAG